MSNIIILQHHAGPRFMIRDKRYNVHAQVYAYIRKTHDFLTDSNHIVSFHETHIKVCRSMYEFLDFQPSWFWQTWILADLTYFDEEYNGHIANAKRNDELALQQKDTVRGRKAISKYYTLARAYRIAAARVLDTKEMVSRAIQNGLRFDEYINSWGI